MPSSGLSDSMSSIQEGGGRKKKYDSETSEMGLSTQRKARDSTTSDFSPKYKTSSSKRSSRKVDSITENEIQPEMTENIHNSILGKLPEGYNGFLPEGLGLPMPGAQPISSNMYGNFAMNPMAMQQQMMSPQMMSPQNPMMGMPQPMMNPMANMLGNMMPQQQPMDMSLGSAGMPGAQSQMSGLGSASMPMEGAAPNLPLTTMPVSNALPQNMGGGGKTVKIDFGKLEKGEKDFFF
jgi:hypothetical protein